MFFACVQIFDDLKRSSQVIRSSLQSEGVIEGTNSLLYLLHYCASKMRPENLRKPYFYMTDVWGYDIGACYLLLLYIHMVV